MDERLLANIRAVLLALDDAEGPVDGYTLKGLVPHPELFDDTMERLRMMVLASPGDDDPGIGKHRRDTEPMLTPPPSALSRGLGDRPSARTTRRHS